MTLTLIFVTLAATVTLGFLFFMKTPPKNKATSNQPKQPYAAVSIVPCNHPCEAVVKTPIYLLREATKLPLASCSKQHACQCKFKHYADRRHQEDRRSISVVYRDVYVGGERRARSRIGRRRTDFDRLVVQS